MSVSRNEPCPCGSGAKYKKCCLGIDEELAARHSKKTIAIVAAVVAATVATFFLAGQGIGSAVGFGGFGVVVAYLLTAEPPSAEKARKKARERRATESS